jgi:hypothetical protein
MSLQSQGQCHTATGTGSLALALALAVRHGSGSEKKWTKSWDKMNTAKPIRQRKYIRTGTAEEAAAEEAFGFGSCCELFSFASLAALAAEADAATCFRRFGA